MARKPAGAGGGEEGVSDNGGPPRSSDVGYRKPPAEHRFRKGQSGNPGGRPKGARNKVPTGQGLEFGSQPANQMLLEEAYRTISVREGDKVVELPVIKAVFRSLGVSAMKGNRLAQATMAELVRGIEEEDRRLRSSLFEAACDYKIGWQQAFDHARKHGLPEPDVVPHPDDIVLDMRRAEVRYEGPMTPEEKRKWDRMLEFRDELQAYVSMNAAAYRRAQPGRSLRSIICARWRNPGNAIPRCMTASTTRCRRDTSGGSRTGSIRASSGTRPRVREKANDT